MQIENVSWHGLDALRLLTDRLQVVVIPALGGKLTSIVDLTRGREWLATNPWLPWRLPLPGSSYVRQFDLGGWDECFPNVAPGPYPRPPWQGLALPDHGEIWSQPWESSIERGSLVLRTVGANLPYRFERTLLIAGDTILLEYQVENQADHPLHYLWSSHPILAIRAGMRIELPAGSPIRTWGHSPFGSSGWKFPWPLARDHEGHLQDLSRIPPPTARLATKLFAGPLAQGWAALYDPHDDARLRFDFHPSAIPFVGLWCNYGGWSGSGGPPLYNLGFEPCRGAPDDLAVALDEWQSALTVPPHGRDRWNLRLTIS